MFKYCTKKPNIWNAQKCLKRGFQRDLSSLQSRSFKWNGRISTLDVMSGGERVSWNQVRNVGGRSYGTEAEELYSKEDHRKMQQLVRAYRQYGHAIAKIDPLDLMDRKEHDDVFQLRPIVHGLKEILEKEKNGQGKKFDLGLSVHMGDKKRASLTEIMEFMKSVYCNKIAARFTHMPILVESEWIAAELEKHRFMSEEEKIRAHDLMLQSQIFDQHMHKKFPTTKRYGLEGCESFIPVMDQIFQSIAQSNISNIVLGMPHRGRLNLLAGVLQLPPRAIFSKVQGNSELPKEIYGIGDVLSHVGISSTVQYGSKKVHVSLLNNPSHLEAVNPVALGKTRAKLQENHKTKTVLVHGDSSVVGQGIVTESLMLCNLPHFTTNGTIHVIVNNQLGFTTGPKHYRSLEYSSDVGILIGAPLFTVNAESLEDVIRVTKIASEYSTKFKKDAFIEIVGMRRWGHNELDEPAFTQPKMYKIIRSRSSYPDQYTNAMLEEGTITNDHVTSFTEKVQSFFETESEEGKYYSPEKTFFAQEWANYQPSNNSRIDTPITGYDIAALREISANSVSIPEGFTVHPRLKKYHIDKRLKILDTEDPREKVLDWALAEACAIGSLLQEGYNVRLSGQDSSRGTFSQRHFKFIDQVDEKRHFTFSDLPKKKGKFEVVSSPLSELGVLGFEYGMSIDNPNNFVIWEAQYGDFSNCAQTIIDTFITNGEDKWCLSSGLTMLLPHGVDGTGPDHSSCRLERYLQACNGDINTSEPYQKTVNMFVVQPTTPANYYHLLRRQMHLSFRKPLVIVGPKILLRHESCVSSFEDMGPGTKFHSVLADVVPPNLSMTRLILCSGKVYYDLVKMRSQRHFVDKVGIIRIEELSPFPYVDLENEIYKYLDAGARISSLVWVQEEHENQGAYTYVAMRIERILKLLNIKRMNYCGRKALSASAVGISKVSRVEASRLLNKAFSDLD